MEKQQLSEEIRREIGQHFVVGFHGLVPSENIKTLIREYYVGNVILMKRNIQSAKQTRMLVDGLQALAREAGQERPLLVGIDQENGLVSAFSAPEAGATFPGAMALAATESPELAEEVSRASATELKLVGINWVYAPVADVNTDSRNPVIGVRSFGDDPEKVAVFARAVADGARAAGVAATAKHFPGHGDTHVDSHLALPRIEKTKAQMAAEELVPFAALVAAGVPSVMTGHMALPKVTGGDAPCSLAREITTGMLREEMGFGGVVVTDCLEMDAVKDGVGVEEGAVRALEAGADVVMICHTFEMHVGAIERVYGAVAGGRLAVGDLWASGARVGRMKDEFGGDAGAWEARFAKAHEESLRLSREAYPRTTTVVWDAGVLPLAAAAFKDKYVLLLTPVLEAVNRAVDPGDGTLVGPNGVRNTAGAAYAALARALERRGAVRHVVVGPDDELGESVFDGAGCVMWVMRNADLKTWQLASLARLDLSKKRLPVVLVSSCGPYDLVGHRHLYESWTAYVATYEFTTPALEALAAVVYGEVAGTGRMVI